MQMNLLRKLKQINEHHGTIKINSLCSRKRCYLSSRKHFSAFCYNDWVWSADFSRASRLVFFSRGAEQSQVSIFTHIK